MTEHYIVVALSKVAWNMFVKQNYPLVGAFLQTWEWGEFQQSIGRKIERYFLYKGNEPVAAFTLVHYLLPLGFSYGYVPRGPVIAVKHAQASKLLNIFEAIKKWTEQKFPNLIFLRLEPPVSQISLEESASGFHIPNYYIQPRHNTGIHLEPSEKDIMASFHFSTRHNIRVAEKRGVTVEMKSSMAETDYDQFFNMVKDIIKRNGGKNPYPNRAYFHSLFKTIQIAAHTDCLPSKVETYLHWATMKEAKRRGMKFYDLGGIDENYWPTLTKFKRQFHGKEFHYVGNIDIPIRPAMYRAYNILRKLNK